MNKKEFSQRAKKNSGSSVGRKVKSALVSSTQSSARPLQAVSEGDIVDIVSPGSASKLEDLEQVVALLNSWGLKPRFYKDSFQEHPFHSNEDSQRLEFLWRALTAKDSKLVWCLRGGYGANRLIPSLLKMKKPKQQKLLIGYSDISSLHILFKKWGIPSVHGPLLETLTSGRISPVNVEEARNFVFGQIQEIKFSLSAMNEKARKIKRAKGVVLGSNLVVLQSSLGTPYQPSLKGVFLALEEIGERGYRIDRMLEHLVQSGILKGCLGIIFGEFLGGSEMDGKNFVKFAIQRFAEQNLIPCWQDLEIGHGEKNRMLPCGTPSELRAGSGSAKENGRGHFELIVQSPLHNNRKQ